MNGFEMTPLAKRMSESGAISIIFEQAIHRLERCNLLFDWHLGLGLFAFCLKCSKSASNI